ncbi:hypothetical protein FZW96_07915 [Bacillus sp. BGMRC 2118]|nr:hypothetical protein FZW96_07915 [Bacillus sp. BGMRC 2118]
MNNLTRTLLYLLITTLVYLIFIESAMYTFNEESAFSGTIAAISFIGYLIVCYLLSRRFEFGRWKYLFFIPFINAILYIVVLYSTKIRVLLPMEEENFGLGILLIPITIIMWILFLVATFIGIANRKYAMR